MGRGSLLALPNTIHEHAHSNTFTCDPCEIALTCHIEGSMIITIFTHLRYYNVYILYTDYADARGAFKFSILSMTTLNQTKTATFSNLPFKPLL
jgi:hypothetical protein